MNLLDLRYRAAGYFAADPSQLVRPKGCRDRLHRTVDESLSALPRKDFDFVWLIDVPPYDPASTGGMMPVWRGGAELDAMRRIKAALDPWGVMNPGKVLP